MKTRYSKWLLLSLVLMLTACEKEVLKKQQNLTDIQFTASMETMHFTDPNMKVYFHNEEWIYWELYDVISVSSDKSTGAPSEGTLVNSTPGSDFEDFNGVFIAPLIEDSKYFLGLHPHNEGNAISAHPDDPNFDEPTLNLYATQPRRNDEKSDVTFARQVFPMVAWYGGSWESGDAPFNLDFHALGGIVRLELFNSTTSATIQNISFEAIDDAYSDNLQLCGPFTVSGFKTNFPFLKSTPGYKDTCKTITLTFGAGGLPLGSGDLRTFYLVLPAMSGTAVTNYHLIMTVQTDRGEFSKKLKVPVRRNGITNMRALGITAWDPSNSTTTAGLAGHGTQERPFKIYTVADLVYLRDCYNSSERKINGQPITEDTYITLMRSDIVLTSSNWHSSSINNFVGHFSDASHAPSRPGITNNSNISLFQEIGSAGHVSGLTVKSNASILTSSTGGISPFCNINRGEMVNCRIANSTATGEVSASYSDLAGIVARNMPGGLIKGCECTANLTTSSSHIAGICLHNSGTISECYITSPITVNAPEVAGICYDNQGLVMDCYFAATIVGSNADWGAIVYSNVTSSSEVKHCYNSGSIVTTKTVGGIVHSVEGGIVNYCWLAGPVHGTQVGGIVHGISDGKIINCYVNNSNADITVTSGSGTRLGGGLVAVVSGGNVENSFVHQIAITGFGATLAGFVASLTGGNIRNCYSYESYTNRFYGSTTLGSAALDDALGVGTTPCYLVGGSQTAVTTVSSSTSGLSGLLSSLNSHTPVDGSSWTDLPPILSNYVVSKGVRARK